MNVQPYLIPSISVVCEEEIKKSLFITHLQHTPDIHAAKRFVDRVKGKHADARHNCWAFVAGRPDDSMKWGFSDDGEPPGTAGKPMLAQLSGSGIGEMTAVVTRYSGGIKLGTGGLVKAYGGGVQQALKRLQTIERKITVNMRLTLDYELIPVVQSIFQQFEAKELEAQYLQDVVFIIEIDVRHSEGFTQAIINKTSARAMVMPLDIDWNIKA